MATFAAIVEGPDAPAATSTGYKIAVGDSFTGSLFSNSDVDWVEITLEAGQTYTFDLSGSSSLTDTVVYLYDANGGYLASDDDGGPGYYSSLTYTATNTASYFIGAAAYPASSTYSGGYGDYALQTSVAAPLSDGTIEDLANYLTHGFWHDNNQRWRAFDTSASNEITVNISDLNTTERALALAALEAWEMVADLTFTVTSSSFADITFRNDVNGDSSTLSAYSTSSTSGNTINSSDVVITSGWVNSSMGDQIGTYGFQTYIHEIGHALGLGHQSNYNGSASYPNDADFANDSWQLSVMSYFSQSDNTTVEASYAYLVSAMMADIVAIQDLYGAAGSGSATSGDTIWGVGSNLTNYLGDLFDDWENGTNNVYSGDPFALTVYDTGGVDTINGSLSETDDNWNLNDGEFSNVGGGTENIGILLDTMIENLNSGSGNDTIMGNEVGNIVYAGAGDDIVYGGAGNDTIYGEAGNDTLDGGAGDDILDGGADDDMLTGGAGDDTLIGGDGLDVGYYQGSVFDYTLEELGVFNYRVTSTTLGEEGVDTVSEIERLEFADADLLNGFVYTHKTYDTVNLQTWDYHRSIYNIDLTLIAKEYALDDERFLTQSYDAGILVSKEFEDLSSGNLYTWSVYTDYLNSAGQAYRRNIYFDDGSYTYEMTDTENTYSWSSLTKKFSTTGELYFAEQVGDDGREYESEYVNGARTELRVIDAQNDYAWASYIDNLRPSGEVYLRYIVNDDNSFTQIQTDTENAYSWSSLTKKFSTTGELYFAEQVGDDGREYESEYVNGARTELRVIDAQNDYAWASYVDNLRPSGEVYLRYIVNDDNSFTQIQTDTEDEFIWVSIEKDFDSSGEIQSQTQDFDDGRHADITFVNGVRSGLTMYDIADVFDWEHYVDLYDAAGDLTSRTYDNDDGSFTFV